MFRSTLATASLVLFAGCAAFTSQRPAIPPVPDVRTNVPPPAEGEVRHDTDPLPPVESGSILSERFLDNGVFELGLPTAPHILLLFTENSCRYCREFHTSMLPRLQSLFIEDGRLRLQIVPFVLRKYAGSSEAAKALLCAADGGRGAAMLDVLMALPEGTSRDLAARAEATGLDRSAFTTCLTDPAITLLLSQQRTWAEGLGVAQVPTFFLDGERLVGLPSFTDLRAWIEQSTESNP